MKEFHTYLTDLKPEVERIVSENDALCHIQSEFLKTPMTNMKQHVEALTKQSDDWLESNGYSPILDTDIKKWEFAEQERQEKLKLTQSQKDEILNTMDSRMKAQVKK